MRVDDHLTQGIVGIKRLGYVYCDVLQQLQHCGNSLRVNTVLWFFKAQYTTSFRIQFQNRQG
jgi:hypothetical protein